MVNPGSTEGPSGRRRGVGSWMRRATISLRSGAAGPNRRARLSLPTDQISVTRHLFLMGAVAIGAPPLLATPRTAVDLARGLGIPAGPRFDAWLRLGIELGELQERHGRISAAGHRLRALSRGDPMVTAWYQSLSGFGTAIPLQLGALLAGDVDRIDAVDADTEIAALAEMTDPLVRPAVLEAIASTSATTLIDVGCGNGRLIEWLGRVAPGVIPTGVERAPAVLAAATVRLAEMPGVHLVRGRIEDLAPTLGRFDIVVAANVVYYQPPALLADHLALLASMTAPGGEVVVATTLAPGPGAPSRVLRPATVNAAWLDLQLRCHAGGLRLPTLDTLRAAARAASLVVLATHRPVHGLPYVVVRLAPAHPGPGR